VQVEKYKLGDFGIDVTQRRATRGDRDVPLEPKAFAVIVHLIRHAGALVARNDLLDTVWGHRFVTPSTLNRIITLARRALEDDAGNPTRIVTVHGAGYRYIGPVERIESPESRVRFAPPLIAHLPARIETLIGRELELATIGELLKEHRAVTVLGPGGIGKTQCALETARRCADDFPDGVWFFDLAAMQSGREWLLSLAAVMAVASEDHSRLLQRVLELLQTRRALFVLDNCDRVAAEVGHWLFQILSGTDRLHVLTTSQALLNFRGERVMRLPALKLPDEHAVDAGDVDSVAAAPAVQMLLERVRCVQPGFHLSRANLRFIAEICSRLDGLPLALELAAARFALLSPEQVLMRLEQRVQFLRGKPSGRDARHQSLAALLDWSFGLLSPEELRLLSWFSVFINGWTVEAAIDLCATMGLDAEGAVELLAGLVDKSLVVTPPGLMPPRYRLLDMVREHAFRQLRSSNEEERARAAHLRAVMCMCEAAQVDMVNGRMQQRVEQLVQEHGNISAAVAYAPTQSQRRDEALKIIGALTLYVKAHGAYDEALRWGQSVLKATSGAETRERGRALLCLGVACVHRGAESEVVTSTLGEAARIAHLNNDSWTEGYAHGYHSLWLSHCGAPDMALSHAHLTARIGEETKDQILIGLAGLARGWSHLARGEFAAAIEGLSRVRDLGPDLHQRHFIDIYIALALFSVGEHRAAAVQFRASLLRAAEVLNHRGMAGSIEGCGYISAKLGHFRDAIRYLEVARKIRERTQVPLFSFWLPHHAAADATLRRKLDGEEYATLQAAGRSMREDAAANEVLKRLQDFGGGEKRP
jgi:predicted ATPase/DNA-binding winged helix-turn-helix (wHTH) protein